MSRTLKCKHFTGTMNDTCEAGVKYKDVQKDHEPIKHAGFAGLQRTTTRSLPCIPSYNPGGATCEKCDMPTEAEIAAEEAADAKHTPPTS